MEFKIYSGEELKQNPELYKKMANIVSSQNIWHEYILKQVESDDALVSLFKNGEMTAFAWLEFCKQLKFVDLRWFFADKNKSKGIENKLLLDKILEHCKSKGYKSLKWVCSEDSWGRINNYESLFKRFGYNVVSEDYDSEYNMSLSIE